MSCPIIVPEEEDPCIGPLPGYSADECGDGDYYVGDLIYVADDAPPVLG